MTHRNPQPSEPLAYDPHTADTIHPEHWSMASVFSELISSHFGCVSASCQKSPMYNQSRWFKLISAMYPENSKSIFAPMCHAFQLQPKLHNSADQGIIKFVYLCLCLVVLLTTFCLALVMRLYLPLLTIFICSMLLWQRVACAHGMMRAMQRKMIGQLRNATILVLRRPKP